MMFFAAAMIMLPVITLLLMINLTIGVVTRSAPAESVFVRLSNIDAGCFLYLVYFFRCSGLRL